MSVAASGLIDRCLAGGAAQAEVLVKIGTTRGVSLGADGGVSWTRTAEGGVALRVQRHDGRVGFASACGPHPSEARAAALVAAALGAAGPPGGPGHTCGAEPRVAAFAAGAPGDGRGLGIFDPRLHASTPADLEGFLEEAAAEAMKVDPRVRRIDAASLAASSSEIHLASSAGLRGSYRQTLAHLSLGVEARDTGHAVVLKRTRTARTLAAFSPALFGDETARLAATALEGRPPAEGTFPALLSPPAAAELLRRFAPSLMAPAPPAGTPIASRHLTIIDDGRLPGGVATAPFDGEGMPTRRTVIVAHGRFQETIHDLASAAASGARSTGNAIRVSFRDPPRRSPSNLFIAPGSDSTGELLAALSELGGPAGGLWIHSLRPTPALARDDRILSGLATGRWVERGRPTVAVAGALVSWPVQELIAQVERVGNDLTFGFPGGSCGAPSLLVGRIRVGSS